MKYKQVNVICRYDSTTGTFTVPPGGDGFYYFSAYFVVWYFEYAYIDIQINGQTLCTAYADQQEPTDDGQATCSATTYTTEGLYHKKLYLRYT